MTSTNRNRPLRVACLGDSHTRGNFGYNWVKQLREHWINSGIEIEGFGVNGELAYNARQRLSSVISYAPDVVVVLIGTNDVASLACQSLTERYIIKGKLPQRPDKDFFIKHLEGIVLDIQSRCDSRIVLVTLPLLGEDLKGKSNQMVNEYNQEILKIGERNNLDTLDLNMRMRAELTTSPRKTGRALHDGLALIARAMLKHYILFQSWNTISDSHGFYLLTDAVHLNQRSGRILASLVQDVIECELRGKRT